MQINQDFKSLQSSFSNPSIIHLDYNAWSKLEKIITNTPKGNWLLLSDNNVHQSCADELFSNIKKLNQTSITEIITPVRKITDELVTNLSQTIQNNHCSFIIACGSGIINDLAKVVSSKNNIDYAIFASAPSMNGYLSANASICQNGLHISVPAKPPKIAIFDLKILSEAPMRLIQSGAADSLCFYTTHLDWLLAHLLIDDPSYDSNLCNLLQKYTDKLANNSDDLKARKPEAIKMLTEHLILSGLAMRKIGSSQPASQGEHMIAHYYNDHAKTDSGYYHGEDIAITSYYMSQLQAKILNMDNIKLDEVKLRKLEEHNNFEKFSKHSFKILEERIQNWKSISKRLIQKHNSLESLQSININANPSLSIWNRNILSQANTTCFKTRDRFTFLDLEFFIKQ